MALVGLFLKPSFFISGGYLVHIILGEGFSRVTLGLPCLRLDYLRRLISRCIRW